MEQDNLQRPKRVHEAANILPSDTISDLVSHPLKSKIEVFLNKQGRPKFLSPTGLTGNDSLRIINNQVRFFQHYQTKVGAIIDPVEQIEWQYSTPCYALSVALLVWTGYNDEPSLLDGSGYVVKNRYRPEANIATSSPRRIRGTICWPAG